MSVAAELQVKFALEHVDEALPWGAGKSSISREFRGHLRKVCAELRAGVDDEIDSSGAGKRDAHEGVGSLEEMIALEAASGCSK